MQNPLKRIFSKRLDLIRGTRFTSFLFIATSLIIAGLILWAANVYYNLDTGEVVMEHVQKVTQTIKALGGILIGSNNLSDLGTYELRVIGETKLQTTEIAGNSELRLLDSDESNYIGFQATSSLSSNVTYKWPGAPVGTGYVLTSDTNGNLSWVAAGTGGIGDITTVGDCASGDCFTGAQENYRLTFKRGSVYGDLILASGGQNATYTLPAMSTAGTYYFPLLSQSLTQNQILLATGNYTLGGNSNLTWDSGNIALTIGSSGNRGQIRILNSTGNFLAFTPTSTLASNITYSWPAAPTENNLVLTSDTNGNLRWVQVSGVGGITGEGAPGYVAFWNSSTNLTYDTAFAWNASNDILTISGTIIGNTILANLFRGPDGSDTVIGSATGRDIILDPASGRISLASGDYIITSQGYEIGKSGTQILKELVPIFGFDLPVKTATSGEVQISRTIASYPLNPCAAGTSRVHKLVIRYGATATTTWKIATTTDFYTFSVPPSGGTTSTGSVYTATVNIPVPAGGCSSWVQGTDTADWYVKVGPGGNEIMIYQIFLAAYDQIL